jgi:hypothetical protein
MESDIQFEEDKRKLLENLKDRYQLLAINKYGSIEYEGTKQMYERIQKIDKNYHDVPLWRLLADSIKLSPPLVREVLDFENNWLTK